MGKEIEPDYNRTLTFSFRLRQWVRVFDTALFINEFVDGLDLEQLGFKGHKGQVGRPGYAPSLLLKIWLYGYLRNILSTRALEQACENDLPLMCLTGLLHPDHNTLWRFFVSHKEALKRLFLKVVRMGQKAGLIGMHLQAIDGTKVAADVTPVRALELNDLEKLYGLLTGAGKKEIQAIKADPSLASEPNKCALAVRYQNKWAVKQLLLKGVEHLSDEEKSQLRIAVETEIKRLKALGVKRLSLSDPDARMMKGGNRQTFFSYNAQVVVDSDRLMIVAALVRQDETDNHLLTQMIQEAAQNTGQVCEESVADGGYESDEELKSIEENGYRVVVHMKEGDRGWGCRQSIYQKKDFIYNEQRDVYICPQGQELSFEREKDGHSQWHRVRIYRCHHSTCPYRESCSTLKRGRTIERSCCEKARENYLQHLDRNHHRELLQKRKQIVEPIFGWIKRNSKLIRWSFRGLEKVQAQWTMICMAINLKMMQKSWQDGQLDLAQCF